MLVALLLMPHVTLCLLRPEVRVGLDMASVIRYSTLTQCIFSDIHPVELCLRIPSLKRPGEPWSQALELQRSKLGQVFRKLKILKPRISTWILCAGPRRDFNQNPAPGTKGGLDGSWISLVSC